MNPCTHHRPEESIPAHFRDAVEWRRQLHRNPQPAWMEFYATAFVAEKLAEWGYDLLLGEDIIAADKRVLVPDPETLQAEYDRAVRAGAKETFLAPARGGFTGVVGILKGGLPGPTVGFRFDIDGLEVVESTESFHRFRVPVAAGKTAELTVEAVHPEESRVELSNLDDDDVKELVDQKRVTPAMQQAFDRILKQQVKIGDIVGQINQRKGESDQIAADQNRIRENMKALKGSSEEKALLQRYIGQLDAQESRLGALRKETADLTAQENAAKAELDRMILEVNVDESF